MDLFQADLQLAAAKHLRWLPSHIGLEGDEVTVEGWALSFWDRPERMRFLINGRDAEHVEWPIASPHLLDHFPHVPGAEAARFRLRHRFTDGAARYPDGFIRLNVTGPFGEHRKTYGTAWYLSDPAQEQALPTDGRIVRVIGVADAQSYRLGGATIAKRFEALMQDRFERSLASFKAVLDWGCGAGRLTRYLVRLSSAVTGVDIDADNIAGCAEMIKGAHFSTVPLMPPTAFEDGQFDLVVGLSVLTHLDEAAQDVWLAELRRIVMPGGLLLLSIQGMAQMVLYRDTAETQKAIQAAGFYYTGQNAQLEGFIPDPSYYKNISHSHDYIAAHWAQFFEVLDIIPAIAGNQDLVVLRRPA
ncbi:MAG: class I SAM-dependent methyltransferase [Elstera sp.]